jgi:hypothetical protein
MGTKLSELLQELVEDRHTHTVWNEVIDFLGDFVGDEVSKASKQMVTEGSGEVPSSTIAAVVERIHEEILTPIEQKIESTENIEVPSDGRTKARKTARTRTQPKSTKNAGISVEKGLKKGKQKPAVRLRPVRSTGDDGEAASK